MNANVLVSQVVRKTGIKDKDDSFVSILTGTITLPLRTSDGYLFEETCEIKLSLKFRTESAAASIGVNEPDVPRSLSLTARDGSLISELEKAA